MKNSFRSSGQHAVHLLLLLAFLLVGPAAASADSGEDNAGPAETSVATSAPVQATAYTYLPLVTRPASSWRLGFGATVRDINRYPEVGTLHAGWYVDWGVRTTPQQPSPIEYAQTVRIHQKLTCPLWSQNAHDRTKCPYAQPYDYILVQQTLDNIAAAARANPGALWLIGNEMDRRDWPGGGQDELVPQVYVRAYYDLYHFIKGIDPTARISIGGVIQATPLRLEYLTKVWDTYKAFYNTNMPVDVWNVHNFILKERLGDYGASIPPGIEASQGVIYNSDLTHIDRTIFAQQIRAFRAWMQARGEQNKPLIVSEYGVLYTHLPEFNDPAKVQDFMTWTFDYFLNTKDCSLGYAADGCRLVQRWAWYSLDDPGTGFNWLSSLFDYGSRQITSTGAAFRSYSLSKMPELGKYPAW